MLLATPQALYTIQQKTHACARLAMLPRQTFRNVTLPVTQSHKSIFQAKIDVFVKQTTQLHQILPCVMLHVMQLLLSIIRHQKIVNVSMVIR